MALLNNSRRRAIAGALILAPTLALLLAGCKEETEAKAPEPRPVRTITVANGETGETVALTGQIQAENEVALAFRIGGRIIESARSTPATTSRRTRWWPSSIRRTN